jgi:uncharacterized protein YcnI
MRDLKGRFGRAIAGASAAAVTGVLMFATPAWAHVTVHPDTIPAGTSDIELTFRVPNERDNANTVGLQVFFPSNIPLLTVDVLPIPGWSAKVDTQTLSKPVQTDDGPVNEVVTEITWTATSGGIAPGQYQDFGISAGKVPDQSGTVVFKSLQTYSSGEIVRWIQVADSQDPNPDTPAPVLTLTSPTPTTTATASTSSNSSSTEGIAVAAIVLSGVAVIGVVILLVRVGRRLGAPPRAPAGTEEAHAP